jgi:class 3 adenylate cyclase
VGLRNLQVKRQQDQLRGVAHSLKELAQWGIGSYAVNMAVSNPDALDLQLRDRSVLFMDIRGFTHWCEQTEPKAIAQILNEYYRVTETAAAKFNPIRMSITGDEVMAIYATPQQAIAAALAMRNQALKVLSPHQLGAGCAIHQGTVVEGLFGSQGVRSYTVIGDVVNTAKRLESSTPAGKITISDSIYQSLKPELNVHPQPPIQVKGKTKPLINWQLCFEGDRH